ncbi:MAG: peptidoglycan DD-metalloendopeptidase family protein [Cyanobacteriota bacterium]
MKRTFTQKVKKVPTCAADSFEALLKLYAGKHPVGATIPLDVNNRRARTSAAMIGLAISMGTTGLLLPRQGDEALAVEPIAAEPTLPNANAASEASVTPAQAAEPERVVSTKPPAPVKPKAEEKSKRTSQPVVEHQVQKGETLWELSKTYEVKPEAISASNKIKPSRTLRAGQKLKIPAVNGIVHEVKPGDTVKSLSESYGVEPTQLRAYAPLSESGQLKTGESVTVPGNVNNLLKARQDVALNNLKEQRNRLNESLAELRSEESTKHLTELAKAPTEATADAQSANPVTLPPAVLKSTEPLATPQPVATALASPVVIPVPTPEMVVSPRVSPSSAGQQEPGVVIPVPTPEIAASPTVSPSSAGQQAPFVVIPVPTPEIAASPTVSPKAAEQQAPFVAVPVPTPEIAASPTVSPKAAEQQAPSLVIPVPTPEIAASPTFSPKAPVIQNITTAPVNNSATAASPQVPQPVVIEPIGAASTANIYKVKPGDTLDAIARRYGMSRSQLAQVNDLNNPNLLSINQPLRIPQPPTAGVANATVALLPSINPKSNPSALRQEQGRVTTSTLVVPTPLSQTTAAEPTGRQPQPQPVVSARQPESIAVEGAKPNPTVLADNKPSQSADSQQNLYVEKLKADILRLREEHRQQRTSGQSSNSTNIAVPTVTTPVASSNNASTPSTPIRVNPEFNPKRQNETLQADRGNPRLLQEPQSSIPIEVPPPETTALSSPQGLVASASSPTGTYNPALRTPVGQTVSPELPSLSAPDMYLPDSPTEFNGYIWPAKGVLTSGYGRRWGRMHRGIDIANAVGTPIVAAAPGVVVSAGWNSGGYGNLVEVQHPDGSVTLYAHNSRILVRRGQVVEQGQQLSEMGSTGYSTGPHLHFEVHPPGRGAVNPIAYLPKRSRS